MCIQQGSGFSSRPVCCQDPGNSGQEWLRLVAGALQGSTNSSAEEPDHRQERSWEEATVSAAPRRRSHTEGPVYSSSVMSGARGSSAWLLPVTRTSAMRCGSLCFPLPLPLMLATAAPHHGQAALHPLSSVFAVHLWIRC